jgi:hypothetical protein
MYFGIGVLSFAHYAKLFLRLLRFLGLLDNKGLYPDELFLESVHEIMGAVFEKDDKAKGEKDEQNQPKQATNQTHGQEVTVAEPSGQRVVFAWKVQI